MPPLWHFLIQTRLPPPVSYFQLFNLSLSQWPEGRRLHSEPTSRSQALPLLILPLQALRHSCTSCFAFPGHRDLISASGPCTCCSFCHESSSPGLSQGQHLCTIPGSADVSPPGRHSPPVIPVVQPPTTPSTCQVCLSPFCFNDFTALFTPTPKIILLTCLLLYCLVPQPEHKFQNGSSQAETYVTLNKCWMSKSAVGWINELHIIAHQIF